MKLSSPVVAFDDQLLQKYDKPIPRYTSFPPATQLEDEFGEIDFRTGLAIGNYKKTPISLYCHIPFCETACYFCGCNTIITKHKVAAESYLDYLERNIEQIAILTSSDRRVNQMHWGGGTPNYLSIPQVERLWNKLQQSFTFDDNAEISIEVNPRFLTQEYVVFLRNLGFKRISFGIQDFNSQVQAAVNRIQPEELLFEAIAWIRDAGFESINVDLIYGLPHQTLATYRDTIRKTIQLDPDRIAVFNFAYVPWMKPIQKRISEADLPTPQEKLAILQLCIEELTQNGYQFIGMDHFAKPNDELAIAQNRGELHRNFQGYTTKPESDLLGFGMTSISMLNDVYVQNQKKLNLFYRDIDQNNLPIEKGVTLTKDDIIRRAVIMELMCQFRLSKDTLETKYHLHFGLDFDDYFAREIQDLAPLEADGLVRHHHNMIEVTPAGRLLIRNIAAVFDPYLRQRQVPGFSRSL